MSEYYEETHDVSVHFFKGNRPKAEIEAFRYPDGSVQNRLNPEELREVAEMIENAADELEEHNNE